MSSANMDAAHLPELWYRRGRFHGTTEACLEWLNLEDEAANTEPPPNLPAPGHPYKIEWDRGRVDGYRDGHRGIPMHPDDRIEIT